MKRKTALRFLPAVSLLIILAIVTSLVLTIPDQASGKTPIVPTPAKSADTDAVVVEKADYSFRVKELNRVLGIPKDDLAKLGHKEIKEKFKQNADKLGVRVYENIEKIDEKGAVVKDELGNTVYEKVLVAGDKIFKAPDFGVDPEAKVQPTPTPFPYPAPVGKNSSEQIAESGSSTGLDQMLLSVFQVFLPLIKRDDPLMPAVYDRMAKAKVYIDNQYEGDYYAFGVVKEYPGCPLSIRAQSGTYPKRFVGHYVGSNSFPVGKVTASGVGATYDVSDVTFEGGLEFAFNEPLMWCDMAYNSDVSDPYFGYTQYHITKAAWEPVGASPPYDLFLGDTLLFSNIADVPDGTAVTVTRPVPENYASNLYSSSRFTIRHATKLGAEFYAKQTDTYKVAQLNNTINMYGFNNLPDVYAPLFESGTSASDNYIFTYDAFHDCDLINNGVASTVPPGYNPYGYMYESKVCTIGRGAYILLSQVDYLAPALQAIHILNKYGDPDHTYPHPAGNGTTTPRLIARWLEEKWNGYGIPVYLKSTEYASGVRTNVFLGLESLLGYKYNDATSQNYADEAAAILVQVQWGSPPWDKYWGETANEGYLFRPIFYGGEMLMWVTGGSYPFSLPGGILTEVMDMFSMPVETLMPLPTNSETTLSYWAALNLYYKYRTIYGY